MSVRAKKSLGQHFLRDADVVRTIVGAVRAGAGVVEIGPGEGVVTAPLLARHPRLVALELDAEAVAHLRARLPALDVRPGDVLDANWPALARELGGPLAVVGNLPYYITSPILFSLLEARAHIGQAVVMVQKEVADRLAAAHGSRVFGTLSVYFQLYARTRLVADVPPGAFRPPPAVESAVVEIDFAAAAAPDWDEAALRAVVRTAFGQRRKMMRGTLGRLFAERGRSLPGWAETLRPEALPPADFVRLAQALAGG